MIQSWKDVLLVIIMSPLIAVAFALRYLHRWFGPRVIYVPLVFAGIFERTGYTTSYKTNWRIAPKYGVWTIAKIEKPKKRERVPPHDFNECPICPYGQGYCDEGQAWVDDNR